MKLPRLLAVLVAVMQGGTPGWALSVEAVVPPEMRLLEEAKTFRIEVEQSFGTAGEKELPFAGVTAKLLEFGGMKEAAEGEPADLTVRIHAEGTPLSNKYQDLQKGELVEHYSGAKLEGWIELTGLNGPSARVSFTGLREPPFNIHEAYYEPTDAPFTGALGGFVEQMTILAARGRGPGVAEQMLALPDSDDLNDGAPQVYVSAATLLGEMKPPGAMDKLRLALADASSQRQAAAARGLGMLGDGAAIPALIERLAVAEEEVTTSQSDGLWGYLLGMDSAFESVEDAGGLLAPRPEILQALRILESPEKFSRLLAALRDQGSVIRRIGAALLLGHMKDARAVEPLIAVLAGDESDMVQAAAANALGALGDKRAALPLLTRGLQAEDGPAKYAALQALDLIAPELAPPPKPPEPDLPAPVEEPEAESAPTKDP
jgi:hypothetical protein